MGPWAFGIPIILLSTLGLILNGYVLLVVLGLSKQTQQQQTANTLLLIHLGAVETALCLILLIFTIGSWSVAGTWCVFHGFLLALLHPVALWTVTGLNCDRYYAIAAPLHYAALVSPRRVAVGLAASWTGALLLCLPPFSGLVPPYRYSPGLGCCAPDFGNGTWGSAAALYGAVYAIVGLGLPAVLVTVCNLRVLGIARYHRHRIASAIYEVTLSAQVTITHQRNPFFVPTVTAPSAGGPPRFHSAASTVMQLVGSLYLLYFPYCGFILWEVCNAGNQQRSHAYPKLAALASFLLACSPPINGVLYGLKSQTLRRSVQNYWRKKATKSELQQEIQARTPSVAGSRRPSGSGNASFFPFPPLQRRLSEALLALGSCRTGSNFESNNLGFQRGRLQPAVSCNTLRVPTAESERRWRNCSTGSESSTGSSDASIWTTNVTPKSVKGNASRNSIDGWSSRRYVRGKNLEEGPLSTVIRPNNNSESSDTTDTTTATTTTTLLKSLAIINLTMQENDELNEEEKEKVNGNTKKREFSESESSWSSVEEIETKAITERNDEDDGLERSREELRMELSPRKSGIDNHEVAEVSEDRGEEAAQLRPLLTPSS
ncbi:galanin receptor type 3-like isoform X3 [Cataglyphis hispanica]|uniref:galanin receptor type 3-like isoform X3 n=1 Tax=Cataglyphis hispanica TaxID=1086592 RepID=UPI00217F7526|nr:galanin receptor type 3-like isoform X3 [Cataglyphis hispanica]